MRILSATRSQPGDFTAPEIKQATQILVDSAAAGMFQTGYDSQDYGTTMNLFTNGQAASTAWEAGCVYGVK